MALNTSRSYTPTLTSVSGGLEELLDNEQFFVERILRRIVWQEFDLAYEVIPRVIAHDADDSGTIFCSISQRDKQDEQGNQRKGDAKLANVCNFQGVLPLRARFFLTGACSLWLPARALSADAKTKPKRWPRKASSSWPERNLSSSPESTSSTQPSN